MKAELMNATTIRLTPETPYEHDFIAHLSEHQKFHKGGYMYSSQNGIVFVEIVKEEATP